MSSHVIGLDAGTSSLREADHLLVTLAAELARPEGVFGCTHLVRGDRPRVALSFTLPSEATLNAAREGLMALGYEATDGAPDAVGRAVLYPGVPSLTGTVTVSQLLADSAIDRVTVLGAPGVPAADLPLITRDHVRPVWQGPELVLAAVPAARGTLVPFEVPDPTPCCADH